MTQAPCARPFSSAPAPLSTFPVQWGYSEFSTDSEVMPATQGSVVKWRETDVYTSKHSVTGNVECALLEVEAGGPEETTLFQSHVCGQGGLPGRGALELVSKDG